MTFEPLTDDQLDFNDKPRIAWLKVQDALRLLAPRNSKLHDLGGLMQSIERYGLSEIPKFDEIGFITAGNGRIEALAQMEKEPDPLDGSPRYSLPRGMALTKSGEWVLPVIMGVNADSESQAYAYLIDSNNLTMAGGDFSPAEIAKMWDFEGYSQNLLSLAHDNTFTLTMDRDVIDGLKDLLEGDFSVENPFQGKKSMQMAVVCPHCGTQFIPK